MKHKLAYLLKIFIILLALRHRKNMAEAKNRFNVSYAQLDTCSEYDILDGGYIYKDFFLVQTLNNNKINSSEHLHLKFYVSTTKDAHILLSVTNRPRYTDRVYEIVIGAGSNTFSTIRTKLGQARVAVNTEKNIISQYDPTPIEIIQTKNSELLVYIPGYKDTPILSYVDPDPLSINYLSFSTFGPTTARWWYDCKFDGYDQELEIVSRPLTPEASLIAHLESSGANKSLPANLTTVNFSFQMRSIALEQTMAILKTRLHMLFNWYDARLAWNAEDYDNITVLVRPSLEIWQPDLVLHNGAMDSFGSFITKPQFRVYNNGSVALLANDLELNTWCVDTARNWPHERINCEIILGINLPQSLLGGTTVLSLSYDKIRPLTNEPMNTLSEWTFTELSVVEISSENQNRYNESGMLQAIAGGVFIGFTLERNSGFYRHVFMMPILACQIFIILSFLLRGYRRGALILLVVMLMIMGLMFIAKHATPHYVPNLMIAYQHILHIATFCYFLHITIMWLELYPPKAKPWPFIQTILQFSPLRLLLCLRYADSSEFVAILEKPWCELAKICNNFSFIAVNLAFIAINTLILPTI